LAANGNKIPKSLINAHIILSVAMIAAVIFNVKKKPDCEHQSQNEN